MTKPVWRVGTKVYRTIYRDDVLVGVMDTPELAQQVVEALNGVAPAPCANPECPICCPKACEKCGGSGTVYEKSTSYVLGVDGRDSYPVDHHTVRVCPACRR